MTTLHRFAAALACLALAAATGARAQESGARRLTLSAGAAYERNLPEKLGIPFIATEGFSPLDWEGKVSGTAFRVAAATSLAGPLEAGVRVEVSHLSGTLIARLSDMPVILDSTGPVEQSIEGEDAFALRTIRSDLSLRYRLPFAGLALELGGTWRNRVFTNFRQTMTLLKPESARFKNPNGFPTELDGRRIIFHDGPLDAQTASGFGAVAGISATIPIIRGLAIAPEILLRTDFSPEFDSGEEFFSWYASAGLSVAYVIPLSSAGGPAKSELAPPIDPPPGLHPSLTASVDLYSTDAAGGRIPRALVSAGSVAYTRRVALPTTLFFDRGSAAIPARYTAGAEAGRDLSADSLARLAPDEAYYQLLGIIARTMTTLPSARMVLNCGQAPGEPDGIARDRGESIRRFLVERWKIDPTRILVADDEPAAIVRVELDPPGAAAIDGAWSERYFTTTPIGVDPAIDAEAGVKSWRLTFSQNGRMLARQRSDSTGDGTFDLAMLRDGDDGKLPSPIVAELTVEDSASQRTTATATLPFARDESAPARDSVVMIHDLFGDAARPGSPEVAAIARSIVERRIVDAHVTVAPIFITRGGDGAGRAGAIAAGMRDELRRLDPGIAGDAVRALPDGIYKRTRDSLPEDAALDSGVRVVVAARQ